VVSYRKSPAYVLKCWMWRLEPDDCKFRTFGRVTNVMGVPANKSDLVDEDLARWTACRR
jgi:hypothetical protein